MKNLKIFIVAAFFVMSFYPIQLSATAPMDTVSTVLPKPTPSAEANALLLRLDQIQALDKSNMTSLERKTLRKETRSIKNQLREVSRGGVYLSVGSIIIIILLLIILL